MTSTSPLSRPPAVEVRHVPQGGGPEPLREEFAAFGLLELVRRRWRILVFLPLLVAALAGAYRFLQPRQYAAGGTFMPQSTSGPRSAISGLAAQLGVSLGSSDPAQSPEFFAALLRTRTVLERVANGTYDPAPGQKGRRGTLADALDVEGESPAERLDRAIEKLRRMIAVSSERETGLIRFTVLSRGAVLSRDIATRLLNEASDFNLAQRQARASADRRFAESRLGELRSELSVAESRFAAFQRGNRIIAGAPELQVEYDRLERDVRFREQVYTSLAQAYEQARLDEVRATPVLMIVEQPALPARPQDRGAAQFAIVVGVCAFALVAFVMITRDLLANARAARETAGA
jgi:uncharacterized protein involved in exopolysaccharide biosynthesis